MFNNVQFRFDVRQEIVRAAARQRFSFAAQGGESQCPHGGVARFQSVGCLAERGDIPLTERHAHGQHEVRDRTQIRGRDLGEERGYLTVEEGPGFADCRAKSAAACERRETWSFWKMLPR